MLKKLFGKKQQEEETIVSPLTGQLVPIEEVPDPTFGKKMLGDGIAVRPESGEVVAPVDGEVVQLFPTKHAIGLKTPSGLEVLIHIGLETVAMKGEGFEAHVSQDDRVKAGDKLISFDLDLVREKASDIITPIVITNGDHLEYLSKMDAGQVQLGSTEIMKAKMKP